MKERSGFYGFIRYGRGLRDPRMIVGTVVVGAAAGATGEYLKQRKDKSSFVPEDSLDDARLFEKAMYIFFRECQIADLVDKAEVARAAGRGAVSRLFGGIKIEDFFKKRSPGF